MLGTLSKGQVLGGTYRVERLLGRGGVAEVYAVAHLRLPRQFALKLLRVDLLRRAPFLTRFQREAEILGRLRHPHIVDVADWNRTESGEPYLVMELLFGEDLAGHLRRNGALPPKVALSLVGQIGSALAAAHRVGVVHRDLKPSNIFLSSAGPFPRFVKVLDFGLARLMQPDDEPLTAQKQVLGTPGYMAPEQARGHSDEIDPRTDQFALAVVLHELLCGRPAFYRPGEPVSAILDRIVHGEVDPPAAASPALRQALIRALSKNKAERFPSLDEFLAAAAAPSPPSSVTTAKSSLSVPTLELLPAAAKTEDFRRRRLLLAGLLFSAALALTLCAFLALS